MLTRYHQSGVGVLAVLIVAAGLSAGCPLDDEDLCEGNLRSQADALVDAVDAMETNVAEMQEDVAMACAGIAEDLGSTDAPTLTAGNVSDQDVTDACNAAAAAIDAAIAAGAEISIAVEGGRCSVNADAQLSCEASCDVEGGCEPGSVTARCTPGELSVVCDGSCEASAVCQGTLEVAANCEGSCDGTCVGTCDGTCVGEEGTAECEGSCDGTCEGTCTGECTIEAEGGIECGANVRCKGGCDVEGTAPQCEVELQPAQCEINADCRAGCKGRASFEAQCDPPGVTVYASAGDAQALVDALEDYLPVIFDAARVKGQLFLESAADVAAAAGRLGGALAGEVLCVAYLAADVAASMAAAVDVSASLSVSVQASASVTASAEAGSK